MGWPMQEHHHLARKLKDPECGKSSKPVQQEVCKDRKHTAVAEVISGYLLFERRETLKRILERKLPGLPADKQKTLFLFVVPSVLWPATPCCLSRPTRKARRTISPAFPRTSPTCSLTVKRLVCNLQELDRDTLVWRLAHARSEKKKATRAVTQAGSPKVCGSKVR